MIFPHASNMCYNIPWWFWAAAVSWAPGQPWDQDRHTYIHSVLIQPFCFFTFSVCVLSSCSCVWLWDSMDGSPPGSSWESLGKNTGVWCCALLQGIFLIQGFNLHLLCLCFSRHVLYPLEPPWKPHFQWGFFFKFYFLYIFYYMRFSTL